MYNNTVHIDFIFFKVFFGKYVECVKTLCNLFHIIIILRCTTEMSKKTRTETEINRKRNCHSNPELIS